MKAKLAELYLQCHRPGGRNEPLVEKALRFAENESELRRKLHAQTALDEQLMRVIHAIQPPEDLRRRLAAQSGQSSDDAPRPRPQFTIPIILTMICGVLSIIGLLVVMEMEHLAHFSGREPAERMIDAASSMSGIELEPVNQKVAGDLGDWFYMHGFDQFAAPDEFSALPAVGTRVLQIDGKPVAQVAIDTHDCLLYMFRASDFQVDNTQKTDWKIFDHQGWAGAFRCRGNACTLVIFRGHAAEMSAFLESLHQSRKP
jgi:hypothetical protein